MAQEFTTAAIVAFDSAMQTIIVALGGAYANYRKVKANQYLNAESTAALSKMTVNFLLPCLIFCQVISTLSYENINVFGLICIFAVCKLDVVHVTLGILLGYLIGKITGAKSDVSNLMAVCLSHTQTTAVPLYYAEVLGYRSITDPDPNFELIAPAYVLIYAVAMIFSNWTVAYRYLLLRIMWKPQSRRLLLEHVDTDSVSSDEEEQQAPSICSQIANIFNAPTIALLCALPLAIMTPLKDMLFLDNDAILHDNVYAAIYKVGSCTSVLILISLGSTLSKGYPPSCDITS